MEEESPSPSLRDARINALDRLYFLYRHLTGKVRKKSDIRNFARARQDKTYRQEFLDGIDLEGYQQYVKKVKYVRTAPPSTGPPDTMMMTSPSLLPCVRRSTISVYPISFNPKETYTMEDFVSALVDHEGFHARNCRYNFMDLLHSFLVLFSQRIRIKRYLIPGFKEEIAAYKNQLEAGASRGISEKFEQDIIWKLNSYHSRNTQ